MKIIYNPDTGLLQPWPAGDAEHVVGLEPPLQEFDVVQEARPEEVADGYYLSPTETINLETLTVQRGWNVVENPPLPAPEAERHKVMEFLMRAAIPLESIPALISSVTQEGVERDVALMRWHEVPTFPKDHPLVVAVAAALDLDIDAVWDTILAIE